MVGAEGLEPSTPALSGPYSDQLSYAPMGTLYVGVASVGIEPTTSTLSRCCSTELSYEAENDMDVVGPEGFEPPTVSV